MNKIIVGVVLSVIVAILIVVSQREKPFDEMLFPGSETAYNFGSCIAYVEYIHTEMEDQFADNVKFQNIIAKEIILHFYKHVEQNFPQAMNQIAKGYVSGKEIISVLKKNHLPVLIFDAVRPLCYNSMLDANIWILSNDTEALDIILNKYGLLEQHTNEYHFDFKEAI